jgi:tetratricopeptide (TPR) repeat protein
MIVKDEATNLPNCLASVKELVEEIVVVDTGSTDNTIAIATDAGARVERLEWPNDFAIARNYALQFVQTDWVLVLDADEVLLNRAIAPIREAILQPQHLVVNLLRLEVGAAQSPYSLVSRLFRHHPAIQFQRPFHELIDTSIEALMQQEPDWQVITLADIAIEHFGYQADAINQRQKLTRAQAMMTNYLAQHPQDAYVCSKLGGLLIQTGEISPALALLQQGLASSPTDAATQYELHYHLGLAYSASHQERLAIQHYQIALNQTLPDSLKLGAYNNLGSLYKEQGDLNAARLNFQRLVEIAPDFAMGHYNLGATLRSIGDLPAAIEAYQRAIQLEPNYGEAYQNLGVAFLQQGRVAESLGAFRQALQKLETTQPETALALRQGLAEMGLMP